MPAGLDGVVEIVPPELNLYEKLKRVHISWPASREETWAWTDVASRMMECGQALCVVNTRKKARVLFEEIRQRGGRGFHLSTTMCPAHRMAVIDEVKNLLVHHQTCLLVSTQLIEAGVDLDFPVVFRELGPLESIIQAAGRCNREGTLPKCDGLPGGCGRWWRGRRHRWRVFQQLQRKPLAQP